MDCELYRVGDAKQMQSGGRFIAIHLSLLLCVVLIGTSCSKNSGTNQNELVDAKEIIHETDSSKLTATNMGVPVNSSEGEFNPEMTSNGLEMFFSSEREGSQDRDLYRARRETPDGEWTVVENMGPKINSPHLDSGPSITADGKTLVFHSERLFNGEEDGIQTHRDLFYTQRASLDAPFGKVELVPGKEVITGYADTAALITDDGKTMYFSSNRPGGIGSKDIYMATREDPNGPFTAVQNMGPNVNSKWVDSNPAITENGLTLFFHSKRPGFGRSDLYVTCRPSKDASWGPARNLGVSANTDYAEANPSVSANGKILLFRSDREGTVGKQDLWQMPMDPAWLKCE
ncbi:MAG: hypothetical protein P8M53_14375 [Pirellulales bacterium]|nr:hypothetical protein [Pirellulales bacterium]